jgi:hypothetical protein
MKSISLILLLFSFNFVEAQSIDESQYEEITNFKSVLIDYEIYQDKVVAITRKNREYFMYYEDTKGAKLFESINIFFATDLEIDCMGNLFLVGLDSAIQLSISDYITRVQTLDIDAYKANIRSCMALFDESLVRTSRNNSLVYEPLDDSIYFQYPVLFTIQIWSNKEIRYFKNTSNASQASTQDATLQYNPYLNIQNDRLVKYRGRRNTGRMYATGRSYGVANELTAFQVGDSLWVFDENNEYLFVYDEYGKSDGVKDIDPLASDFKLCQDRHTQDVYFISADGSDRLIQKVDQNGGLSTGVSFFKGFSKSSLKISSGYLYFRDSRGAGECIKRVSLN